MCVGGGNGLPGVERLAAVAVLIASSREPELDDRLELPPPHAVTRATATRDGAITRVTKGSAFTVLTWRSATVGVAFSSISPACQSAVRRLSSDVASGAYMRSRPTDQMSEASTGCCMGQAWIALDGFGLANRWRLAAVTVLTGFQFAMVPVGRACARWGPLHLTRTQAAGDHHQVLAAADNRELILLHT